MQNVFVYFFKDFQNLIDSDSFFDKNLIIKQIKKKLLEKYNDNREKQIMKKVKMTEQKKNSEKIEN